MKHSEFTIGREFICHSLSDYVWRCTDIGTRTILAIRIDPERDDSWYAGPPYAVEEIVFDESDFEACEMLNA